MRFDTFQIFEFDLEILAINLANYTVGQIVLCEMRTEKLT